MDCIPIDRSHLNVSVSAEISTGKSGQVGVVTNIKGTMPYPKGYVEDSKASLIYQKHAGPLWIVY